jgi:hypothetical protein
MKVNDELERICKEVVVALFKVVSQNSPGGTEENLKSSVRIAGLWAKTSTWDLSNMKQECQPLDHYTWL